MEGTRRGVHGSPLPFLVLQAGKDSGVLPEALDWQHSPAIYRTACASTKLDTLTSPDHKDLLSKHSYCDFSL